jgi:hypothetical protein
MVVRLLFPAVVALALLPSPPVRPISGFWETSEGRMSLKLDGTLVVGTYGTDNGRLSGTFSNGVFTGYWAEDGSRQRCDRAGFDGRRHWGRVELRFGGTEFRGSYSYCDAAPTSDQPWTGRFAGRLPLTPDQTKAPRNLALNKPAGQSSTSPWSRPDDSRGGVDGVKNGSFGFHTKLEHNPWWAVDLGAPCVVTEVRIFNRVDMHPERAAYLEVQVGSAGGAWKTVYEHDGTNPGGGDTPLRVMLENQQARYVRVRLRDYNYLHLDEVEVYGWEATGQTPGPPETPIRWPQDHAPTPVRTHQPPPTHTPAPTPTPTPTPTPRIPPPVTPGVRPPGGLPAYTDIVVSVGSLPVRIEVPGWPSKEETWTTLDPPDFRNRYGASQGDGLPAFHLPIAWSADGRGGFAFRAGGSGTSTTIAGVRWEQSYSGRIVADALLDFEYRLTMRVSRYEWYDYDVSFRTPRLTGSGSSYSATGEPVRAGISYRRKITNPAPYDNVKSITTTSATGDARRTTISVHFSTR